MATDTPPLPTLAELGRDLLRLPRWRVVLSLAWPFVLFVSYFALAFLEYWPAAIGCVVWLSFVTFGSISHDLVHRSLRLPNFWNELFLTSIEMLMLRSGRAYRLSHWNHHARYPHGDDPEGAAAHGTAFSSLLSGPLYFPRLWVWAVRKFPEQRPRLFSEILAAAVLGAAAIASATVTWVPLIYVGLAYGGTWIVPFVTSYVPHTPKGMGELGQTRRFRGMVARLIAFDHLYHLEHHLYPAIPHHRWRSLARRLDPFLDRAGVPVVKLGLPTGETR